jgi:hypothetical protein
MSEFLTCETTINDKDELIETLKEMFSEEQVEVHEEPTTINGYQGSTKKAEIVVRREHVGGYSDLGFTWNDKKKSFDIIGADIGGRGSWQDRVKQAYAMRKVAAIIKAAKRQMKIVSGGVKGRSGQKIVIEVSV